MKMLLAVLGLGVAGALLLGGLAGESPARARTINREALEKATLAGGCFWCLEVDRDEVPGVVETISGYAGGADTTPSYEDASSGETGHAEVVQVLYDPSKLSYASLLEAFWRSVDPHDASGQFCDRGSQYRSAIFYHGEEQQRLAEPIEGIDQMKRLATVVVA